MFGKGGPDALAKLGFEGGLAGYMRHAGTQAQYIRDAILGRHFGILYQPIVFLQTRAIHHYEALLRPKQMPSSPFVDTQQFILLAEAAHLAPALDLQVARSVCETASRTRAPIAFNISAQSLQNEAFGERFMDLLRTSPARQDGLVAVEVTETAEIEDLKLASRTIEMLRSLRVSVYLDDFGSGAADIRVLRALRPDFVKLDGSYTAEAVQGGRERSFVVAMSEMARAAGAKLVAERIETEAEAEALRQIGIEFGQGWLFGRPGSILEPNRTIHRLSHQARYRQGS